jgi:hypothetical protein
LAIARERVIATSRGGPQAAARVKDRADPADTCRMQFRWQTSALLTLLVAVAIFAAVYRPSGAQEVEREVRPEYQAPTASQLASAWAAIQPPRGFHRSHHCFWQERGPEVVCLVHYPSVPMTSALFARWQKELTRASTSVPKGYPASMVRCSPPRGRRTVQIETCGIGVTTVQGQLFTFNATGPVVVKHGKPRGTTATLGHTKYLLRGTQLLFLDAGYPAPQEH